MKSKDPGRPPLFDPQRMVKSMLILRKSELAKRIFGEDEDFRISSDGQEECGDGNGENEMVECGGIYASNSVDGDNAQGSTVTGVGSDDVASRSRKRKSPEKDETDSSSPKAFKQENDPSPTEPAQPSNKLSLTIAPQRHLPFNYKDLVLVRKGIYVDFLPSIYFCISFTMALCCPFAL